jgi:hypothetical protein
MEERKLYHRDVSLGNIFTRPRPRPEAAHLKPRGWLDDFDCAFVEQSYDSNGSGTGTRQTAHEGDALSV